MWEPADRIVCQSPVAVVEALRRVAQHRFQRPMGSCRHNFHVSVPNEFVVDEQAHVSNVIWAIDR